MNIPLPTPPGDEEYAGEYPEPEHHTDPQVREMKKQGRKRKAKDGQQDPHHVEADDVLRVHRGKEDDFEIWGYYVYNNRMYFAEGRGDKAMPEQKSNFSMKVLYRLESSENARRIVTVTNEHGNTRMIELGRNALISVDAFCEALEAKGNFLFWGSKAQLIKIKRKLYLEEKGCVAINTLGWQKQLKMWAWANGLQVGGKLLTPDDHGVVTHEAVHYYIPAAAKSNQDDPSYAEELKFQYIERKGLKFADWSSLFVAVYRENGMVGVAFALAAMFRDILKDKHNFFPMLFLAGLPATGKSTMAKSLMYLFGKPQEATMLTGPTTKKAHIRLLGQFANAIVWMDEYLNSIDEQTKEMLKTVYDGVGYKTAQKSNDSKTRMQGIYSAALISGQEMPVRNAALLTRVILRKFLRRERTPEDLEKFKQLKELEQEGLSCLTVQILKHRPAVEAKWMKAYEATVSEIRAALIRLRGAQDDRLTNNAAALISIVKVMEAEKLPLGFTALQLQNTLMDSVVSQLDIQQETNELAQFWDILAFLANTNQIREGVDYIYSHNRLYLRLVTAHTLYMNQFRQQYQTMGLTKADLTQYLIQSPAFVEKKENHRFPHQNPTSCLVFDVSKLPVMLKYEEGTVTLPRVESEQPPANPLFDMLKAQQS